MVRDMQFSLEGRVAVVTGGSGDLGLAMAQALADAGASIVLASRDLKRLESARARMSVDDAHVWVRPVDVTDAAQVRSLFESTVIRFKRLDILVNAAGIQFRKPAIELTPEEWNRVLNVNLSGTFYCCQAAARAMIQRQSGRIIMISSLAAEIGIPNIAPYVASKGAIRQLTKTLAVEWAPFGITVNSIGPGRFKTSMTEDVFSDDSIRESFLRLIPMGRAGVPADLAGITVFLASDASGYITGQSIYLDGGWLAAGGSPLG
jgi:NAD(P)-dependent dehydrogenase (short-subunit alcohol dehydrogenase family)